MSMDWISKIQKNKILYTRIVTKKYHIPELKGLRIPYTQNPWPGLSFANFVEGKHFSKLDLRQAYHQVEVSEESNNNLAITTHKRLVFDITSNPSIWQRAFNLAPSPSSMIWLLRTKPIKSIWKIQRTCSSDTKRGFEGQPKSKSFSRIE